MKKVSRSMSLSNPAELDNWIETTMIKTSKQTKLSKNKHWDDAENNRDRNKKKREVRIYS